MAEKQNRGKPAESETDVWNAIAAFETILEAIPEDRSSLETLSHAYEHIGDRARALDYLLRLGEIVARERDAAAAVHLVEKLLGYGTSNAKVSAVVEILRPLAAQAVTPAPEAEPAAMDVTKPAGFQPPSHVPVKFRVADELSFAWKLFEAGEISQEDYASVAHDLAELSVDGHLSTVSVLHVLESRAFPGMERVMGYVSRESKTPLVSLQDFELQTEPVKMLSPEFIIRRGAIAFGMIKDDAMVVVMNPFDHSLRTDIEKATGRKCHFFMAMPREFDAAVAAMPTD